MKTKETRKYENKKKYKNKTDNKIPKKKKKR